MEKKPTYEELEARVKELEEFKQQVQDLDEKRFSAIEKRLYESEVKTRAWLENSPICTKIVDTQFNLRYMSQAGIDDLKIDDINQFYGKPYPFEFYPDSFKVPMNENLKRARDTGEIITQEASVVDVKGNELWYHSTLVPVYNSKKEVDYIMVVSVEITPRVKAFKEVQQSHQKIEIQNQELKIAMKKAQEADQLKTAFLANMSHEIRTPLNAISGFTNLLKMDPSIEGEEKNKYLSFIDSGANKLLDLINDLVDISKIDSKQIEIKYSECDLNRLMSNLYSQHSVLIDKQGVVLEVSKGLPDGTTVELDSTRVSQIISNLISNAIKFTQKGKIELGYNQDGSLLTFYVKDTGLGIPEEDQHAIFERFRQSTKNNLKAIAGTGLGLSIAQELTRMMNGKIWVESEPDNGSTFYFTLPFRPIQVKREAENKTPECLALKNQVKMLVAEDVIENYLYLKALLRNEAVEIIHASTGKEAVDLVSKHPDTDIILMDLRMPEMDGLEATEKIRQMGYDMPIIAQSAHVLHEDQQLALEKGINSYLVKPISKQKLFETLDKYLEKTTA